MAEYQAKVPRISRQRVFFQCMLFACTAASAAIAYLGKSEYVAIVAACSTAISSWVAFEGLGQKLLHCSQVVRSLAQQLSWWHSLSEVDQALEGNITRLIRDSEAIIAPQRLQWQISSSEAAAAERSNNDMNGAQNAESKGRKDDSGGDGSRDRGIEA